MVAGAYYTTIGLNPAQGSAYVFTRQGAAWKQESKLTAPDGTARDMFGRAVTATADHVAVGAHFEEGEGQGAVYVFERAQSGWGLSAKLTAAGTGILGVSVWISGHTLISGASFTNVGDNARQGVAYVSDLRK